MDLTLAELRETRRVCNLPCENYAPNDCSGEGLNFSDMCTTCKQYWKLAASATTGATPQEILDNFRGYKGVVN